jgi:tetratricopeptide (TPR) repeat protein
VRAIVAILLVASAASAKPAKHEDVKRLGDAFRAYDRGDLGDAQKLLAKLGPVANADYAAWLRGMVALRSNDADAARAAFEQLAKLHSRFSGQVPWRLADCAWLKGDRADAVKRYAKLIKTATAEDDGDVGTAMFRIAEVANTAEAYRALLVAHPSHPLADRAEQKMLELGGAPLSPTDRIERAKQLTAAHLWDQAITELALVPQTGIADELAAQRDYWTGTTLFEMRRRYGDAGKLLLGVYLKLPNAAEAMFHGARALSRADDDDGAISWYHKVVSAYPHTPYAEEAQFLSGWL